jgi:adenylate kinase family enzyme
LHSGIGSFYKDPIPYQQHLCVQEFLRRIIFFSNKLQYYWLFYGKGVPLRINVIGTSGSGKTTFSRELAEVLGLPCIEIDQVYWGPDWSFRPDEEFFSSLSKLLEGDHWVLDGNYTRTMEFKWNRVQSVIWINYSFPRTVYQAVTRAGSRLLSKEELWPGTGNRENLQMLFGKDSIVLWTIRRNIEYILNPQFSHIKFHRLRSPQESTRFIKLVEKDPQFILREEFGITRT